jgi:hypothetical protein
MVQTVPAKDLTLHDVKVKFRLKLADDERFFPEWRDDLSKLTELERGLLDRLKADYLYIAQYPMPESLVKMVVLSPLLEMAGFYRSPFRVSAETPVQIAAEDEGEIIQGRIDVLVIQERFWVLVIESKSNSFSLEPAIPQALAYMMANPHPDKPTFGLVTNGSNFRFIKLTHHNMPQYALSDVFTIDRGEDLYIVLKILKRLGALLSQ